MEKHEKVYLELKEKGFNGWGGKNYNSRMLGWQEQVQVIKSLIGESIQDVVEFGCGAGDVSLLFAREGFNVTGVDISPTAINWAQSKSRSQNLNAEFVTSNICNQEFLLDKTYDLVIDGNCLHCLFDSDRLDFYSNAQRLLKLGGYLFVSTAVKLNEEDETPTISSIERCFLTEDALKNELDDMGFDIIKEWSSHNTHRHYYGLCVYRG